MYADPPDAFFDSDADATRVLACVSDAFISVSVTTSLPQPVVLVFV
jgi:hypothetical protein